jgi:hypothetical protein
MTCGAERRQGWLKPKCVPGYQWRRHRAVRLLRLHGAGPAIPSFLHCLQATHDLEWPDQVKWGESRIQHKGDGFVAHRITSGSRWSTSKPNIRPPSMCSGDVAASQPARALLTSNSLFLPNEVRFGQSGGGRGSDPGRECGRGVRRTHKITVCCARASSLPVMLFPLQGQQGLPFVV